MESSGFFNAEQLVDGSYDLNYVAEQFAQYFALFVGNGIFIDDVNNLQASAAGGMDITFNNGAAFWNGYWYINDAPLVKTVDLNLEASARIDSFVIRFDIAGRDNKIQYKKGDTSVQRADGVYELQLCTVRVEAGASEFTDAEITDMRTNENVCGFVKGLLEVVQTDDLFKQFSTMFNTWFEGVKNTLDGDVAGNIIGMIGSLTDLQTMDKSSIVAAVNEVKEDIDDNKASLNALTSQLSGSKFPIYNITFEDSAATTLVQYAESLYNYLSSKISDQCVFDGSGLCTNFSRAHIHGMFQKNGWLEFTYAENTTSGAIYRVVKGAGADAVSKKLGSVSSYGSLIYIGGLNTSINAANVLAEYGIEKADIKQANFLIQPTGGSWSGFINANTGLSGGMFYARSVSYDSSTGVVSTDVRFRASGSNTEHSQPSTVTHSFSISGNFSGSLWYFTGE